MNERMNAHVVQSRKETDRQGQQITASSCSLLSSIKEHKERVGVTMTNLISITIDNLSQQISKSKKYVVTSAIQFEGKVQCNKRHASAEDES